MSFCKSIWNSLGSLEHNLTTMRKLLTERLWPKRAHQSHPATSLRRPKLGSVDKACPSCLLPWGMTPSSHTHSCSTGSRHLHTAGQPSTISPTLSCMISSQHLLCEIRYSLYARFHRNYFCPVTTVAGRPLKTQTRALQRARRCVTRARE